MEDSEKIAAHDVVMGFIADQMKLERYFIEVGKESSIDSCRADAFKRIVEVLVGPMARTPSNLMKAQVRQVSKPAAATRKPRARKSPAKKSQSLKKSSKRDA
jgi:hypothetical protein